MRPAKAFVIASVLAAVSWAIVARVTAKDEPVIREEPAQAEATEAQEAPAREVTAVTVTAVAPPPAREPVTVAVTARPEEDPEDRADPIARAQRDYEERTVRELRNPGILPE
jgi:hypothetical protein